MPRLSERGTLSGGGTSFWAINKISESLWGIFNIAYFFFRSLLDPLINMGGDSPSSGSRSSYGRGPPRPPGGRRNIRTIADALGGSDSIPPPPPGG